jgi:hypothetical protein
MTEEGNQPILETITLLEDWILDRISSFDRKTKFYRTGAYWFTLTTAGLSSITTILIGIGQTYDYKPISIASLMTSGFISFFSAWEGLYGYRQRWIQNNDALMKFYALDADIQYQKARSGNQLTQEEIDQFYKRYQGILQAANEKWREDRQSNNN